MNVYLFRAALLCEDCGIKAKAKIPNLSGHDSEDESYFDSDDYPKGPYPNGGGEADCPQHCGHCQIFLENPLTEDGYNYVVDAVELFLSDSCSGDANVIRQWFRFYNLRVTL